VWKERHQHLSDTVSFLVATCEENVVRELREQFGHITAMWDNIFPHIRHYMHAGDILRQRRDYRTG